MGDNFMKIAICDDEYSTCNFIENIILQYAKVHGISAEVDIYQTAKSLCENIVDSVDLLFLDIQLPDDSGVEIGHFLRKCSMNYNLQIVFISGNPGYALELFKIRPMDFLIKPIPEQDIIDILDEYVQKVMEPSKYFLCKFKTMVRRIAYNDILYFSSETRKSVVHLKNGEKISVYRKLSEIETELPEKVFWRIHKSYIINSRYLVSCQHNQLQMSNNDILPVSRNYKNEIYFKIINQ